MDGDIVYPGDLNGRVIVAGAIALAWDGNVICALVGQDVVVGVSGFGDSVHAALHELADNLIREAVWVEVPEGREIDIQNIRPCPPERSKPMSLNSVAWMNTVSALLSVSIRDFRSE